MKILILIKILQYYVIILMELEQQKQGLNADIVCFCETKGGLNINPCIFIIIIIKIIIIIIFGLNVKKDLVIVVLQY